MSLAMLSIWAKPQYLKTCMGTSKRCHSVHYTYLCNTKLCLSRFRSKIKYFSSHILNIKISLGFSRSHLLCQDRSRAPVTIQSARQVGFDDRHFDNYDHDDDEDDEDDDDDNITIHSARVVVTYYRSSSSRSPRLV